MSKFSIINLIDKLFVSVCVFLVIFSWINFYIRSLYTTLILSIIFSFAVLFIIFYLFSKNQAKKKLNKKTIEEINQNYLNFKLLSKNNKVILLNKILSVEHKTEILNNLIFYSKDDKKHLFYLATNLTLLSQDDLLNILEDVSNFDFDIINIVCHEYNSGINKMILKNVKINFINQTSLYMDYFKKYEIFPNNEKVNKEIFKPKLKEILKSFISKEKSKAYFFSGLILLFSSFILPFNTYYIVFGSVLMLFAIACKLMKFKDY